jgi:hypothetical protein
MTVFKGFLEGTVCTHDRVLQGFLEGIVCTHDRVLQGFFEVLYVHMTEYSRDSLRYCMYT